MALTKVSTDGVKDDAITSGKIPANAVGASELADNAVDTNAIANNAVTAGKTSGVQTTINNNAANRVITGSGTANTLNGNSDLLWNGSRLDIDTGGTEDCFRIGNSAGCDTALRIGSIGTATDTHGVIKYDKDDNYLSLLVSGESHGNGGILIANGGNVGISTTSPAVKLDVNGKIHASTSIGIRTTSPQQNLHVHQTDSGASVVKFTNSTTTIGSSNGFDIGLDSSEQGFLNVKENKPLQFSTNNTERMRILAGGGLTFNGDTAAANALDDYEEGTYTPTFSTGMSGISYTIQYGNYVKIGKLVRFDFHIQVNGGVSNAAIIAFTLPFNSDAGVNGHRGSGVITYSNINDGNQGTNGFPALYIGTSSAQCYMGASPWYGSSGSAQSNRYFIGGGTYHTP